MISDFISTRKFPSSLHHSSVVYQSKIFLTLVSPTDSLSSSLGPFLHIPSVNSFLPDYSISATPQRTEIRLRYWICCCHICSVNSVLSPCARSSHRRLFAFRHWFSVLSSGRHQTFLHEHGISPSRVIRRVVWQSSGRNLNRSSRDGLALVIIGREILLRSPNQSASVPERGCVPIRMVSF